MTNALQVIDRSAIFNLPWQVAAEDGHFAREGVEVTFPVLETLQGYGAYAEDLFGEGRRKEQAFHVGSEIDVYNACEWGTIKRTADGQVTGKIIAKRASVVDMAIVAAPNSKIYALRDLLDVPVVTGFYNGDHFVALELLEGPLGRDGINLVHHGEGGYDDRIRGLLEGRYRAATVMEPYLSLAEANGCRVIAEDFFRGADVASPDLDADTVRGILRALGQAVRTINADPDVYVDRFLEEANQVDVPRKLRREDFRTHRLRFVEPEPYGRREFEETYRWMVSWDLVRPGLRFEDLVRADLEGVAA